MYSEASSKNQAASVAGIASPVASAFGDFCNRQADLRCAIEELSQRLKPLLSATPDNAAKPECRPQGSSQVAEELLLAADREGDMFDTVNGLIRRLTI